MRNDACSGTFRKYINWQGIVSLSKKTYSYAKFYQKIKQCKCFLNEALNRMGAQKRRRRKRKLLKIHHILCFALLLVAMSSNMKTSSAGLPSNRKNTENTTKRSTPREDKITSQTLAEEPSPVENTAASLVNQGIFENNYC